MDDLHVSDFALAWADIKDSKKTGRVLFARAIGIETIENGKVREECLKLEYGGEVYGFLPKTYIDNYQFKSLQFFLGKTFEFVVDDVYLETQQFLANRIKALHSLSVRFWKNAKENQRVEAFVRGVDPYKIYLLVDGIEAVMPREEYSYSFIEDLREEVEIGDTLPVKITKIVRPGDTYQKRNEKGDMVDTVAENGIVEVSSRLLERDPWTDIIHFKKGSHYVGTINKIHPEHGLFIQLKPGLIVRTNFPPRIGGERLKKGQEVNIKLTDIDVKARKIKALVVIPNRAIGKTRHQDYSRRGQMR
ncbi:S1 RNA-binding domain-containing protein [Brevibacillus choshinensis]|uniref:S1 RNA-binding domain-containing protein n=1 Tax=Brevibacillus choshinensis TaxID=54911 RepID=UPI002E1D6E2C|nr:S1 RNA-binding domain-containing protein [Brevibacillus choshinensis]MED4779467.1 S1 RNA-binding domain-containing protein [Brevibacillus choshinensis]